MGRESEWITLREWERKRKSHVTSRQFRMLAIIADSRVPWKRKGKREREFVYMGVCMYVCKRKRKRWKAMWWTVAARRETYQASPTPESSTPEGEESPVATTVSGTTATGCFLAYFCRIIGPHFIYLTRLISTFFSLFSLLYFTLLCFFLLFVFFL